MARTPNGTFTFLFTDIEGSTRRWEQYPKEMSEALARHDRVLRKIVVACGGSIFKTTGDGVHAVFTHPTDALAAAVDSQKALQGQEWGALPPLLVRMALHTGVAEQRDRDYFGPTLNRIARLLAIGHGGQVLLSQATQRLIADALREPVTVQDLGFHRLKDLQQPEQVYQLLYPGLPAPLPPLRSLSVLKHNLPVQLTSFIGRESEMQEVKELLKKARLVTLTGTGGCGKTRLALQVAADIIGDYPDGVWLVELAALSDPTLVVQTVALALGIVEQASNSLLETLLDHLKARALLLVLDNCEHLVDACALLAEKLLKRCPHIQLLATSRETLHIAGEQPWHVPSLSLPDPTRPAHDKQYQPEMLSRYDGVRLFVERAQVHRRDFRLDRSHAQIVAAVCSRLDGIPLAIELAAARLKILSIKQLALRLDDRFRLLTNGSRTALPHHRTLWLTMDWSFHLLSDQERRLLARLAVFAGSWTLEAAEAVCQADGIRAEEVLDLLAQLVNKSLTLCEERDGQVRYWLLETIRQYAWAKLEDAGELETIRQRHLAFFLDLAETAEPRLHGAQQAEWLIRLEWEHENLRTALERCQTSPCRDEPANTEAGLRLAGALWRFWATRGHWSEGRILLEGLLSLNNGSLPTLVRAKALNGAGNLAHRQGDYAAARAFHEESLAIRRAIGDQQEIAGSLNNLGLVAKDQGDYATACSLLTQSLEIERALGREWSLATTLENLALLACEQGDYATARQNYEESVEIWRRLGDSLGIAGALAALGSIAWYQADQDTARALFEQSLTIRRQLGDPSGIATSLTGLGNVAEKQGDLQAARACYEEVLVIDRALGDQRGVACTLGNLGNLTWQQGELTAAQAYCEEALAIEEKLGDRGAMAVSLNSLGAIALGRGDEPLARTCFEQSLAIGQQLEGKKGMVIPLINLSALAHRQEDDASARRFLMECLALCQETDDRQNAPEALEKAAALVTAHGQPHQACRLWGAAQAMRTAMGIPMPAPERADYDRAVTLARTALESAAFETAWTTGRHMTREQSLAYALEVLENVGSGSR